MRTFSSFAARLALMSACAASAAAAPLFNLGDQALPDRVASSDATVRLARVSDTPSLRIEFGRQAQYPGARFEAEAIGFPSDWSKAASLAITVVNEGRAPLPLGLRIDSRAAPDRGRQATATIPPGKEVRLVMPIGNSGAIVGMIGQPPSPVARAEDVNLAPGNTPFDPTAVKSFRLFVGDPSQPHTLLVRRVELLDLVPPRLPFVDRFGQFSGADWPGKVKSEEELIQRGKAERANAGAVRPIPGRTIYGGWADGPQVEATGRFRVQKHGGKWWFVDPDGRLFWSSGITCVRFNNATRVGGRENFYAWLPSREEPLARFYGGGGDGRTFDFYAANLYRKHGDAFEPIFFEQAARRLIGWGVNTIGNWSDPQAWALRRVPYTVPVSSGGGATFVVTERLKAGRPWVRRFPDPFDPRFAAGLDGELARLAHLKGDPWLLGVFVDNELPWAEGNPPRNVSAAALELPRTAPVKAALLKHLRASYSNIGDLNAAFGTRFAAWEEASAPWQFDPAKLKSAADALTALDVLIAEQYFRTCREAVRRHLPGALYLGCRFHVYNRAAIAAAKKYCDVVCFNIYAYRPSERLADELATEMDFPAVIGEFHFGATDRGMFHPGLRKADNQNDRADKYVAYMTEAAAAPWCVGAHWFQYLDQALTGRRDGENYNIGFINATDDPYPELTTAARRFNEALYRIRSEADRR